jgi:5'-phosphate synthase pdxT subunit
LARIGVLALQGDWAAHGAALGGLGVEAHTVRTAIDLEMVDALVMPGGESTAMLRLMEAENLAVLITDRAKAGMPILATCAGVILLAREVTPEQPSLGVLAIDVDRNAYGRQPHSTVAEVDLAPELGEPRRMEGVFIRAPRITRREAAVEVLGRWREDDVLVRQGKILAATFHPELATDRRIHELFVRLGEDAHG